MPPPRYPSDLSDEEWALLKPLLSSAEKRARPPKWPTRQVADGVFYLLRSDCSWRMLPREYPPSLADRLLPLPQVAARRSAQTSARSAAGSAVREAEGREPHPSAAVIDSQVVRTTPVGGPERCYDGARRLAGRERHILVDTNGLVLAAQVHGANLPDRDGGRRLLAEDLQRDLPRMQLVWADGAYTHGFREWAEEERGWRVEVPYHRDRQLWRYELEEKPRGFSRSWRGDGWWKGRS